MDNGLTQVEIAKKLDMMQVAVSFYLDSNRGERQLDTLSNNGKVRLMVNEVTEQLPAGTSDASLFIKRLCELCENLRSEKSIWVSNL